MMVWQAAAPAAMNITLTPCSDREVAGVGWAGLGVAWLFSLLW